MRVVTLLPGATEIVAALGGAGSLVAISHECDYPASVQHLPRVIIAGNTAVDQAQQTRTPRRQNVIGARATFVFRSRRDIATRQQ